MLLTSPLSTGLKSDAPQEQRRQPALESALVILDPRVDDLRQLLADLLTQDVLVLDPAIDGIEQITAALQSRQSISSLHIISHGASGSLEIGSTRLTLENLTQYSESLQTWSKVLSGRDLLLYGCQVAKGALGYLFLQQLHQLTEANLAASVERVGRVDSHHNWILETQVGQVKTQPIFSPQLQQSYAGHFETVNFSLSTDTVIESEGTPFSFNFSVDGPIPAGGSIVRLEGSIPQAINQWDLFQLDFSGLAGGFGVGIIDVSPNQDFSAFDVVITEPNASISLPIFNDFQDDSPQEVTWTVTPVSAGTTVNNSSATVTIFDDPSEVPAQPSPTPELSLTSDITTLVEDEGTEVTFTISLSEPPPDNGLIVGIGTGKPLALGDFDVFPPPPQAAATGGQLVAGFPDNSGFNFRVTAQTATVTLPIFDDQDRVEDGSVTDPDGPLRNDDIGEEQTTFSILPGEGYTINSNASSVTLTLLDTQASPNTPPEAENDSYSTNFETALTVNASNGVLNNDTDSDGDSLSVAIATDPTNGSVSLNTDGSFTYTPDEGFSGSDAFTYTVIDGNEGSDTATVTVTVEDVPPPPPEDGEPVVSFSTTPEVISEAEGTALVLNFGVEGDIPEEGITVNLEGDAARIMQEFTVAQTRFDAETGNIFYRFDDAFVDPANGFVVGGILDRFSLEDGDPAENNADPAAAGDAFLSNFSFTITEANASITIPVLDDIVEEPDQTFTYTLVDGDGYAVDATANSGTFTVTDGVPGGVGPTVGVTASPTTLIESEQTVVEVAFTVEGDIPADGLVVQFQGPPRAIAEFDVNATNPRLPENETAVEGVVVTGGSIVGTDEVAGSLFLRIFEPTATVTVPVFQDDVAEGTEVLPFTLLDGEDYEVDPTASEVTITIEDDAPDGGGDVIQGTDVDDTLIGDESDNTIEALGGDDTVAGDLGNDIIMGGDGEDILRGDLNSRSPQDDVMGGDDIIFGGEGNDRIGGKSGNDILSGDAGDDQIWGDDGDDILMGVTGNDILVGDNFSDGSGSDLFVFGNGDGTDTILDFEVGTDRIGLVEGELVFSDITLTQDGSDTLMGVASTGEILAVLNNVQASALSEDSFAIVPDVSNPEEALQII